jgi:tetratricopeptide (TPR) repeat protein
MTRRPLLVCFCALFVLPLAALAQDLQAAREAKPDLSKEAFVFENYLTRLRFENDGTGTKELQVRVRIQSEAGVQQLGLVRLGYNSASEKINVAYVKVIKPDGSEIVAKTDLIQDLPSEIQQVAPQYTDFREKHINVPALRPGDTLEYKVETSVFAPMIPGQFFTEYSFERNLAVENEQFEINVPSGRKLVTKFGAEFTPEKQSEGDRTTYSWKHANMPLHTDEPAEDAEEKQPDIQVTSFLSWSELAHWFSGLEKPREEPTEAVREKAAELTAGLTTESEKVQAIYKYVSTTVRYVGLSFGVGRFQPHAAAETMKAQYGDCKDKHTLLASLLAAAGISADSVLIHTGRKLDPDVPSPSQFNHLISAIHLAGGVFYSDTTAEVSPMGYVLQAERGKQALLITPSGEGRLIETPKEPLTPTRDVVNLQAKITPSGDLIGDVTNRPEGDVEIADRLVFRRIAEAQWPQVLKVGLAAEGLDVDVSEVTVLHLDDLSKPLELRYHVEKKHYVDLGTTTEVKLPIPSFLLRPAANPNQKKGPIRLGKQEQIHKLRLASPPDFLIVPPTATDSVEDFVEYHATYKIDSRGILTAERGYKVTRDEVPRDRFTDYNKVYDKVNADEERSIYLSLRPGSKSATVAKSAGGNSSKEAPEDDRTAAELYAAAMRSMKSSDLHTAQKLLENAVEKDPKDPNAWAALGSVYLIRASWDKTFAEKGISALKREVEIDPRNQEYAWQKLAAAYSIQGKYSEAAEAMAHQVEVTPNEPRALLTQADFLLRAGRPADAVVPLEAEIHNNPQDKQAQLTLAKAYILSGKKEKAQPIVDTLVASAQDPMAKASVADMLGEADDLLDLAEEEIQKALTSAYGTLQSSDIKQANDTVLQRAFKLAMIWQSAGQVYLKSGDLARAQSYLEAAWAWSQQFRSGELLAQVYMKQGRREDAVRTLASALGMTSMQDPGSQATLAEWAGDSKRAERLVAQHRLDMQEARTLNVANPGKVSGSGEFYIFVGPGSKIEEVGLSQGDAKLKPLSANLKKARLELPFPDEQPIHVLRMGILSCFSLSPTCRFVLTPTPPIYKLDVDGF